jgi:hypothetical protein
MKCEDLLMKKRSPLLSVLVVLVLFLDLLSELRMKEEEKTLILRYQKVVVVVV